MYNFLIDLRHEMSIIYIYTLNMDVNRGHNLFSTIKLCKYIII